MFSGEYSYKIDNKKRLAIPVKFRKVLGKRVVITRGLDGCLFLYSTKGWEVFAKKLSDFSFTKSDVRGLSRVILGGAMEVNIDKLGRILVPDYLKEEAGLKKEAIIVGLYNRIEIWDSKKWSAYKKDKGKNVEDIAERLNDLGV
jgi:MraZ protein